MFRGQHPCSVLAQQMFGRGHHVNQQRIAGLPVPQLCKSDCAPSRHIAGHRCAI